MQLMMVQSGHLVQGMMVLVFGLKDNPNSAGIQLDDVQLNNSSVGMGRGVVAPNPSIFILNGFNESGWRIPFDGPYPLTLFKNGPIHGQGIRDSNCQYDCEVFIDSLINFTWTRSNASAITTDPGTCSIIFGMPPHRGGGGELQLLGIAISLDGGSGYTATLAIEQVNISTGGTGTVLETFSLSPGK